MAWRLAEQLGCSTDVLFHLQIPASDRNLHAPVLSGESNSQSCDIPDREAPLEKNPVRGKWSWPSACLCSRFWPTRSTRYPLALARLGLSQIAHLGPSGIYWQYCCASSGFGKDPLVGKPLRRGVSSFPGKLQTFLAYGSRAFLRTRGLSSYFGILLTSRYASRVSTRSNAKTNCLSFETIRSYVS